MPNEFYGSYANDNDDIEDDLLENQNISEDEDEDDDDLGDDDSDDDESDEGQTWIQWFLENEENEYFVEIDDDFLTDDFNWTGMPHGCERIDIIKGYMLSDEHGNDLSDDEMEHLDEVARKVYGLLHSRFIITKDGIAKMREFYNIAKFGRCPRFNCSGQAVLPIGLSDIPGMYNTYIYCPRCQDIYTPRKLLHSYDGAYFGTTFAHFFLMQQTDILEGLNNGEYNEYVPRVFGFKIHKDSAYHKHRRKFIIANSDSPIVRTNYNSRNRTEQIDNAKSTTNPSNVTLNMKSSL